ncbi:copper amine oxidase N-terminal domain-containing protein [Desulforamulus aquiferis]|uniref:Copper amine oxidase N-terminal domain-containing protein n=1 Tax=Desulforamulus aquiferis TaxID=1397668 RepID=A0AAW7ZCH5_9FIRM|nr:copper amine oxidase N-terminal domain-containing protein [Desulforamulus aquiferis]MDO7787235.1 copper amine oxidase N-terminal domain-containing protein [Desulforamulus aquiferis]
MRNNKTILILCLILFLILNPISLAAATIYIEAPLTDCYVCGSFFRTDKSSNWGYYNGQKTLVCPFCSFKQAERFHWIEKAEEKLRKERLEKAPPLNTLQKVQVVYNNKPLVLDPPGVLIHGRCYIPVKSFTEAMGGNFGNPSLGFVGMVIGNTSIQYATWNNQAIFTYKTQRDNGYYTEYVGHQECRTYDCEAVNIEGNDYIPIRFVSDALGATIKWDPSTSTINIDTLSPQRVKDPKIEKMAIEAVADMLGISIISQEEKEGLRDFIGDFYMDEIEKKEKEFTVVDIAIPDNVLHPPGCLVVRHEKGLTQSDRYYKYYVVKGEKVIDEWVVR